MDPVLIAEQLRKPTGELGTKVGDAMNLSNINLYDQMFKLLPLNKNNKILEIGFGNGKLFHKYFETEPDLQITGIDYSAQMCEEAKNNNKNEVDSGKLKIISGNAGKTPFNDAEFDLITTINTIYFWDEPENILSEIKRILKPGGKFYIGLRPRQSFEKIPVSKHCFTLYEFNDVILLLEKNGFKIINSAAEQIFIQSDPDIAQIDLELTNLGILAQNI